MNPAPDSLSDALIARLAQIIPTDTDNEALIMVLDLEGFDTTDAAWVKKVRKRAARTIWDRRASFGALARLDTIRLTNEEVGKWLDGMPKSTVQAMVCGRIPERFTKAQKAGFARLLDYLQDQIDATREALG